MSTEPPRLDSTQFESVEDATERVAAAGDYDEVAKHFLARQGIDPTALPVLFFLDGQPLQQACTPPSHARCGLENPHAVFSLIRAYSEGAALLIYVYDHIDYVEALIDRPIERQGSTPARLRVGRLVAYAVNHAPGFKHAYDELTDFTHFGSTAMWSPFVLSDESESFSWTSYPRWKNDEQAMIAAALTLEVSDASHTLLGNFGGRYLQSRSG